MLCGLQTKAAATLAAAFARLSGQVFWPPIKSKNHTISKSDVLFASVLF
jgi:hypothetical protein